MREQLESETYAFFSSSRNGEKRFSCCFAFRYSGSCAACMNEWINERSGDDEKKFSGFFSIPIYRTYILHCVVYRREKSTLSNVGFERRQPNISSRSEAGYGKRSSSVLYCAYTYYYFNTNNMNWKCTQLRLQANYEHKSLQLRHILNAGSKTHERHGWGGVERSKCEREKSERDADINIQIERKLFLMQKYLSLCPGVYYYMLEFCHALHNCNAYNGRCRFFLSILCNKKNGSVCHCFSQWEGKQRERCRERNKNEWEKNKLKWKIVQLSFENRLKVSEVKWFWAYWIHFS